MYKLLIVDDEELIREYLNSHISNLNADWTVAGEASDGMEALEFLENQSVDLVLTDIKMPLMDGLALCEKVKSLYPNQRLAILSGYDDFHFAQKAIKFGVFDYLLKPLKISELSNLLSNISSSIKQSSNNELTFRILKELSTDYQKQISRNYIKAIILNSNTEIKVLHPLIFKLKIDLFQTEGVIMILSPDIDSMVKQKLPPEDLSIFKYILNQLATELVEDNKTGYVFLDSNENVIVYMTGENAFEIKQNCKKLYNSISSFFCKHTNISVTGSIGSIKSDVLEMGISYKDALDLLSQNILLGGSRLFENAEISETNVDKIGVLKKHCIDLINNLTTNNDSDLHLCIVEFVNCIDNFTIDNIIRYSIFILEHIKVFIPDFNNETYNLCIKKLSEFVSASEMPISKSQLVTFYYNLLIDTFRKSNDDLNGSAIQNIVSNAENFILGHFTEPITLAQIADHLKVSPNHLSKVFHQTVGESYIKYITRIRMEYAARLLKANPNERIATIAEKSGYYNLKHFNFVFKEYYNVTPGMYQKS